MTFDYGKYASGEFVTFPEPGASVVGIVKEVREGRDYNGNPCPELILEVGEDGDEKTLTAGQVMLKAALVEQAPAAGDKVRITFTGLGEGKPGRNPPKMFTVEVKRGPHELVQPVVANTEAPF